jgi:hypothetical protein
LAALHPGAVAESIAKVIKHAPATARRRKPGFGGKDRLARP